MRCSFVPPYLVQKLAASRPSFVATLHGDAGFRFVRQAALVTKSPGEMAVYDAQGSIVLPGSPAADELEQTIRVRDWASATYDVVGMIDAPDAVVRYGQGYANAFYNGQYLVFGQGDGEIFGDFTGALDVFSHELGHDMVADGPGLLYAGQPGALNEHWADVLGICVSQCRQQSTADWRLGQEIFLDGVSALRDMLNPGTAYDSPELGTDPQPSHMDNYVNTTEDNGGVHINSGIPNRAFALFTMALGVPSWQTPLAVWRSALAQATKDTDFHQFAALTVSCAGVYESAVRDAWGQVGIIP